MPESWVGPGLQFPGRGKRTTVSDMVTTCACLPRMGKTQPRNNGLHQLPRPGECLFSSSCLKPDNSTPHHVFLPPFQLLLQRWSSERVTPLVGKSLRCVFKRRACEFSCTSSHSVTISTGFHNQHLWGLLSTALEPWAGIFRSSGGWGGDPPQPK